jgi:hypothetical protein
VTVFLPTLSFRVSSEGPWSSQWEIGDQTHLNDEIKLKGSGEYREVSLKANNEMDFNMYKCFVLAVLWAQGF